MSGRRASRQTARHTLRTGLVAAVAITAVACGLPSSSPVGDGLSIGQPTAAPVHVVPVGPAHGSPASEIITGFLRASALSWDDAGVAREFLTPRASTGEYRPDGSALIMPPGGEPKVEAVAGTADTYRVSFPVVATIDEDGRFAEVPAGTTKTMTLTMSQVDQQWRISGGLRGFSSLLTDVDVGRYGRYDVIFLSQVARVPVPDPRYFPVSVGLPTRLSQALLAGPPTYLQGAVATGVPEYTDLNLPTVTVDNGVAQVNLTRRGGEAAEAQRRQLWDQFVLTLTSLPAVNAVQLTTQGTRIQVDGLPNRPVSASDLGYADADYPRTTALARTDETTTAVSTAALGALRIQPVSATLPRIPARWHHLAMSPDRSDLAATDGADLVLTRWHRGTEITLPSFATELTRPAYDRAGFVWVGGRTTAGSRLFVQSAAVTTAQAPTALNVPWIAGRRVISVGIADDGQRALVVSADPAGRTLVQVAGVVRKDGAPVGLADPITLGQKVSSVVDGSWIDARTVGVIGTTGGKTGQVVILPIGGPSEVLDGPAGGERLVALQGVRQLVVVAPGTGAYLRAGNTFERLGGIGELVVPGR